MKIILHIGTHKTGTSAIQKFLKANSKLLCTGGVLYPCSQLHKSENQFSHLSTMLRQKKIGELKKIFEAMKKEARKKGCDTILLSGENFSTLDKKSVERLRKLLDEYTVEVVVYFRNVYDFIVSAFVEINKFSKNLSNIHNLNKRLTRLINYDLTLNIWTDIFGSEAIYVHSYDLHRSESLEHFIGLLPLNDSIKLKMIEPKILESFSSVNAKVDPLASFIISIMGFLSEAKDYELLRRACKELEHNDKGSEVLQRFLSKLFFDAKAIKFEHSKLQPIREHILPEMNIDTSQVFSVFKSGEYLYLLGKLLMVLSLEFGKTPWYKSPSKKNKLAALKRI